MLRPLIAALALLTLPAAAQLVPEGAAVEKVADGYKFTEGPAAGPDGCIYFTDIPAELILKYDPETGETVTVFEESGQANGLMFDRRMPSILIACRHQTRDIAAFNRQFDQAHPSEFMIFEGKKFNSPNDLAIDESGNIYFTDPRYGNRDSMEMEIEGVYFMNRGQVVPDDKRLTRIDADLTRPNGIVLSPDETILYVADNAENWIYAYDIVEPGKVQNKRQFARLNDGKGGGSDGMCVDAKGRLYATGHGKVWVFEPNGELVTTIDVGPQTTNCTFAKDGRTLYITANKGLYRIELNTDEPLSAIDIELDLAGTIQVEGRQVEKQELTAAIQAIPGFSTDRALHLHVPAELKFREVSEVLGLCQQAGLLDIHIHATFQNEQ